MTVTQQDLTWWLALAPTLPWRFAKTMADHPHSYVVRGRTLDADQFDRAARVIRTFGQPNKFYAQTDIHLVGATHRWWVAHRNIEEAVIINQAEAGAVYGVQDAPRTVSGTWSVYDSLATEYDARYATPECEVENAWVRKMLIRRLGAYAPTTLDIGCGTGLLLDLGITHPALYTGVDPSQGMLNALVVKHPQVVTLHATQIETLMDDFAEGQFDLVTSLFGAPSYVHPETIELLPSLATRLLVLMHYQEGYVPDYETMDDVPHHATSREVAISLPGAEVSTLGNFIVTVVR